MTIVYHTGEIRGNGFFEAARCQAGLPGTFILAEDIRPTPPQQQKKPLPSREGSG